MEKSDLVRSHPYPPTETPNMRNGRSIRDQAIEQALEELRRDYAEGLPERGSGVVAAARDAAANRQSVRLLETAKNAAHRLRGGAGSHGFDSVSVAAGRLEDAVAVLWSRNSDSDAATVVEAASALEEVVRAAVGLDTAVMSTVCRAAPATPADGGSPPSRGRSHGTESA